MRSPAGDLTGPGRGEARPLRNPHNRWDSYEAAEVLDNGRKRVSMVEKIHSGRGPEPIWEASAVWWVL